MDAERLIEKLAPVARDDARRWRHALRYGDTKTREMVELAVKRKADAIFGSVAPESLLSLPPRSLSRGEIKLGTVLYEKPKWGFALTEREVVQNVFLGGRSGSGKSNLAAYLIRQLVERGTPVMLIDWKRNGRGYLPLFPRNARVEVYTAGRSVVPLPFNPWLSPPGMEPRVYLQQVVDLLSSAYSLGDGARSLLYKALTPSAEGEPLPTLVELIDRVQSMPVEGRSRGWQLTALRALESVRFASLTGGTADEQSLFAERLANQTTIVEVDGLSQSARRFLVPLLCLWLYQVRLKSTERETLEFVIVLEEAHHVLHRNRSGHESTLEMLLRQCRELGLSFIVIDQHPSLISQAALANTFTSVVMNTKDPADARAAAAVSNLSSSQSGLFNELPVGEAIVKLQDRWHRPFKIRVPLIPVAKGEITDSMIRDLSEARGTLSGVMRRQGTVNGALGRIRGADQGLNAEELEFVADVIRHPDSGVNDRYRRLGWSADRGTRVKRRLLGASMLEESVVPVGRTRKMILRTKRAADWRGAESVPHEYWKRFYWRRLRSVGFNAVLEAKRVKTSGRVDLLAKRGQERIALEVETGRSDIVENVRRDLRERVDRVIVTCTSAAAKRQVERKLGKAGLLIPARVTIVERDAWHPESDEPEDYKASLRSENSRRPAVGVGWS